MTSSLQKLQNASKDTRDALTAEVAERHDSLLKLKQDVKELEDKHREALATANHRGEVIKQLRDEIQTAENRVSILVAMLFLFLRLPNYIYGYVHHLFDDVACNADYILVICILHIPGSHLHWKNWKTGKWEQFFPSQGL